MTGRILSHYRIVDEISRRIMGVELRVVDPRLNREVTLTVLPEELLADADRKRRFAHWWAQSFRDREKGSRQ